MVSNAYNVEVFSNFPRIFEEKARELSRQHSLNVEGEKFLLSYVSVCTRLAFEVSERELELDSTHRQQSELLSSDSDGRLGEALSELKRFIETSLESPNVQC